MLAICTARIAFFAPPHKMGAEGLNQLRCDPGKIGVKRRDFITVPGPARQLARAYPFGQSASACAPPPTRSRCGAGTVPNGAAPLMRLFVTCKARMRP